MEHIRSGLGERLGDRHWKAAEQEEAQLGWAGLGCCGGRTALGEGSASASPFLGATGALSSPAQVTSAAGLSTSAAWAEAWQQRPAQRPAWLQPLWQCQGSPQGWSLARVRSKPSAWDPSGKVGARWGSPSQPSGSQLLL